MFPHNFIDYLKWKIHSYFNWLPAHCINSDTTQQLMKAVRLLQNKEARCKALHFFLLLISILMHDQLEMEFSVQAFSVKIILKRTVWISQIACVSVLASCASYSIPLFLLCHEHNEENFSLLQCTRSLLSITVLEGYGMN